MKPSRAIISNSPPTQAPGRDRWLAAALIAAAVFLGYANSIPNEFVFDDKSVIVDNQKVTRPDWIGIWTGPSWFPLKDDAGWRPATSTTFAFNWLISGNHAAPWRTCTLLLHGVNSILVMRLAALIGAVEPAPLIAGLLFALHPIHTEVLNPIVGRADVLATLFLLLCCLAYWKEKFGWVLAFFSLGLFCKESAVTFLFLLPFLAWMKSPERMDWRRLIRDGLPLAAIVGVYALLRKFVIVSAVPPATPEQLGWTHFKDVDNPLSQMPLLPRLSNALYIAWRYLFLLAVPAWLSADYSPEAIPLLGTLSARNLLSISLMTAGAWFFWRLARHRRDALFAAAFFICTFILVSNLPFTFGTIMAERLIYMPSVGFCILLALALVRLGPRPCAILSVLILALYAGRSYVRNQDWKDNDTIFINILKTSPNSVRAMVNASAILLDQKRYGEARDALLKAISLNDSYPLPFNNLGLAYMGLGDLSSAEKAFQQALKRDPGNLDAQVNIGIVFARSRRLDGAIAAFEEALKQEPDSPKLHYNLALAMKEKAEVLYGWGQKREARLLFQNAKLHYERALQIKPDYPEARANLQALIPWISR